MIAEKADVAQLLESVPLEVLQELLGHAAGDFTPLFTFL